MIAIGNLCRKKGEELYAFMWICVFVARASQVMVPTPLPHVSKQKNIILLVDIFATHFGILDWLEKACDGEKWHENRIVIIRGQATAVTVASRGGDVGNGCWRY